MALYCDTTNVNDNSRESIFELYNKLYGNNKIYGLGMYEEEDKKMTRDYNDIVNLYNNREIDRIKAEKEEKIREVLLKDTVVESIVNLLKGRENELGLEEDTLINKFCENGMLIEIVPKEIKDLCEKVSRDFVKKMEEHNRKIKEVRAILKMTETWAEMKEVLIRYGIINWTDWDEK